MVQFAYLNSIYSIVINTHCPSFISTATSAPAVTMIASTLSAAVTWVIIDHKYKWKLDNNYSLSLYWKLCILLLVHVVDWIKRYTNIILCTLMHCKMKKKYYKYLTFALLKKLTLFCFMTLTSWCNLSRTKSGLLIKVIIFQYLFLTSFLLLRFSWLTT